MKKWVLPLAMLSLTGLVGCTTQSMKGTPFFFGDYEDREGPPADRFNAWPLVYYRDPALSVLWPLMEFSPEHQAVRPIYSADGLGSNYPEYNVVWPIARFAPGKQKYRIFPVFWGDDYLNVFPLWIWSNRRSGDSLYVAWPLYARYRSDDENAWYLWPLYGQKKSEDSVSRSVAWPLIHMYSSPSKSGSWAFPLYGYDRNGSSTSFYSLPYSRSVSKVGKSWDLALPLWYRNWLGDARSWALFPALSWGNKDADDESTRAILAAGLAGFRKGGSDPYSYVLPLYYAAPKDQSFLSLPYSTWKTKSGQKHLVLPLLSGWNISSERTQALVAGGLVGWEKNQKTDQLDWSHLLPLYLWERDELFYTLLFGKDPKRSYFATPLIGSYNEESGKTGSWVFPFYRHKRDLDSGAVNGSYLLLGEYGKNENRTYHSFSGVYDYRHSKSRREKTFGEHNYVGFIKPGLRPAQATELGEVGDSLSIEEESTYLDYFIGTFDEQWTRTVNLDQGTNTVAELHSKKNSIFPLWESDLSEDLVNGQSLKTTSLLGILYDTRREEGDPENPDHEYVRKRVLWRLFHYEKLNGDKSTDIFPAVTLDSYKNGYRKASFLWRLFRYEKNPETGSKKLDLFFIPIKR